MEGINWYIRVVKAMIALHVINEFTITCYFDINRDQETQTKTDASTNVPRPQVFLAGLRGGGMSTATNMVKVDLTQDVDQT
jgi:hypothetical protein